MVGVADVFVVSVEKEKQVVGILFGKEKTRYCGIGRKFLKFVGKSEGKAFSFVEKGTVFRRVFRFVVFVEFEHF